MVVHVRELLVAELEGGEGHGEVRLPRFDCDCVGTLLLLGNPVNFLAQFEESHVGVETASLGLHDGFLRSLLCLLRHV